MRIYLDNAATSFPKPLEVYEAVDTYQRRIGVAVGRGSYREAISAQRIVDGCRSQAARLLGAESPDRIVFTFNGTDSLNLVLMGLCQPGDHVVSTTLEHNSVLRPLRWLREHRGVDVTLIEPRLNGRIEPNDIRAALRPETKLVALIHASNVTGAIQPIDDVGAIARQSGVLLLVDAAQTAGHLSLNVADMQIDLLACPGHKGLLGPLGTGLVYIRPGVESRLAAYRLGGTGTESEEDRQPLTMPERFESGNHNAPGLAGLDAGLKFVDKTGVANLRKHELELTGLLVDGMKRTNGLTVYGHDDPERFVGVVSFNIVGYAPQEAAAILDDSFDIQCRAGLHCAPGAHRFLKTIASGGTVRLSVGPFTTAAEIEQTLAALRELGGATSVGPAIV